MASDNAKKVAQEVLKKLRKGQKVDKGDIIRGAGYSESVSLSPTKVTETDSYKEEVKPITDRWKAEIRRIQTELEGKNLSKERYKDLVDSVDKLNKQVQLAEGKPTENVKNIIDDKTFEQILKNYANKR